MFYKSKNIKNNYKNFTHLNNDKTYIKQKITQNRQITTISV